jgi:hypothetical protein
MTMSSAVTMKASPHQGKSSVGGEHGGGGAELEVLALLCALRCYVQHFSNNSRLIEDADLASSLLIRWAGLPGHVVGGQMMACCLAIC